MATEAAWFWHSSSLTLSDFFPLAFLLLLAALRLLPADDAALPPLYAWPLAFGFLQNSTMCSMSFAFVPLSDTSNKAHTCFSTSAWY